MRFDSDPRKPTETRKLTVSVIIPARNEEDVIAQCLKSLTEQALPRASFEVILVNNGSTDRTLEIARGFEETLTLTTIHKTGAYISALRNIGVASSRGDFVAFLDADCIAPSHWLSEAVELLRRDAAVVIGARYTIPDNSSWLARAWYQDQHTMHGPVPYLPGGDLLSSREAFEKVSGFDETIETNEDFEFCQRASRLGLRVLAIPSLSVIHLGTPQTIASFYRKHLWQGTSVLTVLLKDGLHSRNLRSVLYAIFVLSCLVTTALGLPITLSSRHYAALFVGPFALFTVSMALAVHAAKVRKRWGSLGQITIAFLIYGLARAAALLHVRSVRTD